MKTIHREIVRQSLFRTVHFVKLLALFSVLLSAQKTEPNEAYKTVLRMKLNMDKNPVLYLDELESFQLNKVHQACVEYLDLAGVKATENKLIIRGNAIKNEVEKLSNIKYDQGMQVNKKKNIRYFYFSSKSERE